VLISLTLIACSAAIAALNFVCCPELRSSPRSAALAGLVLCSALGLALAIANDWMKLSINQLIDALFISMGLTPGVVQ
jgi:hypothetical protein